MVDANEDDGAFEYYPVNSNERSVKQLGKKEIFLFDANSIHHRGSPQEKKRELHLIYNLAHTNDIKNIVNTNPGTTWPVDPYMFLSVS